LTELLIQLHDIVYGRWPESLQIHSVDLSRSGPVRRRFTDGDQERFSRTENILLNQFVRRFTACSSNPRNNDKND